MTKLCAYCSKLLPSWKRSHALFCKPSCRVLYYRQSAKRAQEAKESVNSLGVLELEVTYDES